MDTNQILKNRCDHNGMSLPFTFTLAGQCPQDVVTVKHTATIGRSHRNDIQLFDPKVSRFHCKIERTNLGITLSDLHSKNGSYVNGVKRITAQLKGGDSLKIGNSTLKFTTAALGQDAKDEQTSEIHSPALLEYSGDPTAEFNVTRHPPVSAGAIGTVNERRVLTRNAYCLLKFATIGILKNKIYLAAASIIVLTIGLLLVTAIRNFVRPIGNSEVRSPPQSAVLATGIPDAATKTSRECHEKAMKISREANTLLESGDFRDALKLYYEALAIDPENLVAKEGLTKTRDRIEKLAEICLKKGELELKNLNYKEAEIELENVLLLLADYKDHRLIQEANKLLLLVEPKVSE